MVIHFGFHNGLTAFPYPYFLFLGKEIAHLYSGQHLLDDRHARLGGELSPDLITDATTPKAFIWKYPQR